MLVFILLSVFRNFTLLPSTVLVIAGTLLFPERLGLVFSISLVGVVISAALVYFLFEFLGLDTFSREGIQTGFAGWNDNYNREASGSSWRGPPFPSCQRT